MILLLPWDAYHNEGRNVVMLHDQQLRTMKFEPGNMSTGCSMDHAWSLSVTRRGGLDDDIWDFGADETLELVLML